MASAGRPRKPTALKLIEGDRGKGRRPINKNEPKPEQDAITPPEWLSIDGREKWEELMPSLMANGVLTNWDVTEFAAYCETYAKWVDADKHLQIEGTVMSDGKKNPYFAIYNELLQKMNAMGSDFGLSPSSRAKLDCSPLKNEEETDPMAQLLSGSW